MSPLFSPPSVCHPASRAPISRREVANNVSFSASSAQQRGTPQIPHAYTGLPTALGAPTAPQPQPPVNSPPTGYALPQPTASGSLDLSKIKPTASGRVSLNDALAKVKAKAAEMGVHRGDVGSGGSMYPFVATASSIAYI